MLPSVSATTVYRRAEVGGIGIFYREAGPADAPVVVLLHGFPSSSRMFDALIPLLAPYYRVIAPDYPGFGHSELPEPWAFAYTFDGLAEAVGGLLDRLGVKRCAFCLQDYGGPVGFRVMAARPDRVAALVIQNANAYAEGLGEKWQGIADYWSDPAAHGEVAEAFLSLAAARERHVAGSARPERCNPDAWTDEFGFLSRPGQHAFQTALLQDYRTNVASYPDWQEWLRACRPPTLVAWGANDPSFTAAGAEAFRRHLPDAEIHLLDAGHFVLDERLDEVAGLMLDFLGRHHRDGKGAE